MNGKERKQNGLESVKQNGKGLHDDNMMTKKENESLVDSSIESTEGERYSSIENDKKWKEFLTVANEILIHYYNYLKENGEEM